MGKLKKWYNKKLVEKYDGKNIDLLSAMGEKRPFWFSIPLYSLSLYTFYAYNIMCKKYMDNIKSETEKLAEAIQDEMMKAIEKTSISDEELSKEIQKSFGTKIDQVFYDDIFGRKLKKKGE